jgi:sodium/potassium-transporting ATPase subunit alpha
MEKVVKTGETDVESIDVDVEKQRGRIQYAAEVGRRETLRRSMSGRRSSMDSLSIRPARRSIDPSLVLPPTYRTL